MQPSKTSSPDQGLTAIWRSRGPKALALLPVAVCFSVLSGLRRVAYRLGLAKAEKLPVSVVVVGNITTGGAGKTPLTLYLAQQLAALGRRPGIVSRGYGGSVGEGVVEVTPDSDTALVGDEPLLLRRRAGCPVFVGRRRAEAARALLTAHPECDLILCDDGLQHYALGRDLEIAVMDRRGLMNGWPLPAGPLREPASRLRSVNAVVLNGLDAVPAPAAAAFRMTLLGDRFVRLDDPQATATAADLAGLRLHAVAGIGEPRRFFDYLRNLGLDFEVHPFPDHHAYAAADLAFNGDAILTTEKDAVKFASLSLALPVWVLPVAARVEPDLARFVLENLHGSPSA